MENTNALFVVFVHNAQSSVSSMRSANELNYFTMYKSLVVQCVVKMQWSILLFMTYKFDNSMESASRILSTYHIYVYVFCTHKNIFTAEWMMKFHLLHILSFCNDTKIANIAFMSNFVFKNHVENKLYSVLILAQGFTLWFHFRELTIPNTTTKFRQSTH